jgi:hypothetical protein
MPKPSQALLDERFFEFKKQAGEGLCWVRGCGRRSKKDRCLCHMHEMRRWRAKSKRTADFCALRDHARARGIKFEITPDYWKGFTDAFGYYVTREDEVLSVDRVNPTKGYEEGNLRIVAISINSAKSNKEKHLPEHVQHMLERRRELQQKENEKYLAMDPAEQPDPDEWDESEYPDSQGTTDDNCPF